MNVIPIYVPDVEFQERKKEIQNLIARMVIAGISKKPGRPKKVNPDDNDLLEEPILKPKRKYNI